MLDSIRVNAELRDESQWLKPDGSRMYGVSKLHHVEHSQNRHFQDSSREMQTAASLHLQKPTGCF